MRKKHPAAVDIPFYNHWQIVFTTLFLLSLRPFMASNSTRLPSPGEITFLLRDFKILKLKRATE